MWGGSKGLLKSGAFLITCCSLSIVESSLSWAIKEHVWMNGFLRNNVRQIYIIYIYNIYMKIPPFDSLVWEYLVQFFPTIADWFVNRSTYTYTRFWLEQRGYMLALARTSIDVVISKAVEMLHSIVSNRLSRCLCFSRVLLLMCNNTSESVRYDIWSDLS